MIEDMKKGIGGECSLRTYRIDDKRYACLGRNFDTGCGGCSGTYMETLASKHGFPHPDATGTEHRYRDLVRESDEEKRQWTSRFLI